jgi:hypothetical protein
VTTRYYPDPGDGELMAEHSHEGHTLTTAVIDGEWYRVGRDGWDLIGDDDAHDAYVRDWMVRVEIEIDVESEPDLPATPEVDRIMTDLARP